MRLNLGKYQLKLFKNSNQSLKPHQFPALVNVRAEEFSKEVESAPYAWLLNPMASSV